MGTFKDNGIVIKEVFVSEADKLVTLLLKEHGKVTVYAKGARKPKSKFSAVTQPFSYCGYVIFEGNGFLSLAQGDLIESFYAVRNDLKRYCYGCFFLEITDKMILAGMPSDKVLYLVIKSLRAFCKETLPSDFIFVLFQYKFLQLEGLMPITSECSYCGKKDYTEYFFCGNGALCRSCLSDVNKTMKITKNILNAIDYILKSDINNLFTFTVSDEILSELLTTANFFRTENVDLNFKSLELL